MALNISSASTNDELLSSLRCVDISVPPRTDGRTTHHTETWAICRLLSTLANEKHLSFPISVNHRDRPDFLICAGKTRVGVEVTEAVSERYAAYMAVAEREFPNAFLEPAHFRWSAPKLTVEEMRGLLRQSQLTSDGWVGDGPEKEWALFIQNVVDAKLIKLARPEFEKFDQNWLSIYDNLPLPNVHLEKALTFLRPLLEDRWLHVPGFDVLFVEHGPIIARITPNETTYLVLNDLWT